MVDVGQELLNVPFAEMVEKLALAIAKGQTQLDMNSTEVAKFMAEQEIELPGIKPDDAKQKFPIIALGFFPGFYQFQEAIIEVKMAITMATSTEAKVEAGAKVGWGPFAASVNASYSSKYDYKNEGSSLLRVRMVPVPPPTILQDYMDAVIEARKPKTQTSSPPREPVQTVAPVSGSS
jgi:hypothetical protein